MTECPCAGRSRQGSSLSSKASSASQNQVLANHSWARLRSATQRGERREPLGLSSCISTRATTAKIRYRAGNTSIFLFFFAPKNQAGAWRIEAGDAARLKKQTSPCSPHPARSGEGLCPSLGNLPPTVFPGHRSRWGVFPGAEQWEVMPSVLLIPEG